MKKIRKILPFIPILGVLLTIIYHMKYGDTGIEKTNITISSAIINVILSLILLYFLCGG